MKLTRERNREALKRYRHLKPARGRARRCGKRMDGSDRACTLPKGHRGPHASHGLFGRLHAVWGSGDGSAGSAGSRRGTTGRSRRSTEAGGGQGRAGGGKGRGVGPRRPLGLKRQDSRGALERVKAMGVWVGEHFEEILLLSFFAASVWFAIDWLMIIFR